MNSVTPVRPHKPLETFYDEPQKRAAYLNDLFDNTAQHYDWISSVLAFGSDKRYREMALRKAGLKTGMKLLDVATGTGLVAQAALDLGINPADIVALDPSRGMLRENMKKRPLFMVQGVGERLPFPGSTFDFITMGYALRHVETLDALFQEFIRVLKPEGSLLVMELSRPESKPLHSVMKLFMEKAVPLIARFRTRDEKLPELMRYYWATIEECVPPADIVTTLKNTGFSKVERRKFGPVLNDYYAQKS
ncbi:MAG: class I SAM-dependent methyltransferase [Verrucomicrobiota bacterium]|nr:class I SAM-dependent methyltransferase [Verrucomicrobiota bacterium]